MKTGWILTLLVLVCLGSSSQRLHAYAADDWDEEAITVAADLFIARPLGVALTAGGTALYLASLPISLISRTPGRMARLLILRPLYWTTVRPLGHDLSDI